MNSILVRRSDGEVALEGKSHDHQHRGAHGHVADHVEETRYVVDDPLLHRDAEAGHRIQDVAGDEHRVEDAQRDQQLIEGVLHLGLRHDEDRDAVAGQTEQRHDHRHDAVDPQFPNFEELQEKKKYFGIFRQGKINGFGGEW